MDFGKLPSVEKVDFQLPAEPPQNAEVLANCPKSGPRTLYVGPTGYNMKPWVGKWYPFGAKEPDFLRYFAGQFNTIEFNTTHYRMPDPTTVRRWRDAVPPDFRFCPKVPQSISHARDLGLNSQEPQIFCEAVAAFGDTLGCSFLQLPPHFGPRDLKVLSLFLEKFASKTPLSVELRHPHFFQTTEEPEGLWQMMTQYGVAAVITDVAGRRDVCHMRLSAARTLIRFVGNGLHPSDFTRVDKWAERLKNWFENGLQEAYFFTHEPDNLLAPELTAYCVEAFEKVIPDIGLRGPRPVSGQQGTLF